jgi:uncharacterized membrane protein
MIQNALTGCGGCLFVMAWRFSLLVQWCVINYLAYKGCCMAAPGAVDTFSIVVIVLVSTLVCYFVALLEKALLCKIFPNFETWHENYQELEATVLEED